LSKSIYKYKFSPEGFTADEIITFAELEKPIISFSATEAEVYGAGKQIRSWGFYPSFLPLRIYMPHGPSQLDGVEERLLDTNWPAYFFHSDRLIKDWKAKKKNKAYKIISPAVMYRRLSGLKQSPNAKGSLFFYAHSHAWADFEQENDKILDLLNNLPDAYHPVSVCFHFADVERGRHQFFIEKGYSVFSAGNWKNPYFIENIYEIMRNFKFTITNTVGSNIFYSIDLGLPVAFIDAIPKLSWSTDKERVHQNDPLTKHKQRNKVVSLFFGAGLTITEEQKKLVTEELGLENGIGRLKFSLILYRTLFIFLFKRTVFLLNYILQKLLGKNKEFLKN
jgi:hypothetical protein